MKEQSRVQDLQTIKEILKSLNELCNRMIIDEEKLHKPPSHKKAIERENRKEIISKLRTNLYTKKKVA